MQQVLPDIETAFINVLLSLLKFWPDIYTCISDEGAMKGKINVGNRYVAYCVLQEHTIYHSWFEESVEMQ